MVSDLHLETPVAAPQYAEFELSVEADNLLLPGDVGITTEPKLSIWLRKLLEDNPACRIFYVMGNHEPYRSTYEESTRSLRILEDYAKDQHGGQLLCRDRYDIGDITILGCTLWSDIDPFRASEIASRSTDLHEEYGIRNWTLERHQEEHKRDIAWLNDQVASMQGEPQRQIIIVTHDRPTVEARVTDPKHQDDAMSSNFATDLSTELCWSSPQVKLWAFGHTQYNCSYRNEGTGRLVIANQKGYVRLRAPQTKKRVKTKVVESNKDEWSVLEQAQATQAVGWNNALSRTGWPITRSIGMRDAEERPAKSSLFRRVVRRLRRRSP